MTAKPAPSVTSLIDEDIAADSGCTADKAELMRRGARVLESASSDLALVVHAHAELLAGVIGREEAVELLGKMALGFGVGVLVDNRPDRTDLSDLVEHAALSVTRD